MPVSTPTKITDYGRYRVFTEMGSRKMRIGNDYSRSLSNVEFAGRMVVKEDPKLKIAKFSLRIQQAIAAARLVPGMTKEQVIMSIGNPILGENPSLEAPAWRYWLTSFEEFQVNWDDEGVVASVTGIPTVLSRVYTAQLSGRSAASASCANAHSHPRRRCHVLSAPCERDRSPLWIVARHACTIDSNLQSSGDDRHGLETVHHH